MTVAMATEREALQEIEHATLTVAEILELDVVQQANPIVLAGAENLDRMVRWVHISEQPDIADYLKGSELLLITLMGLGPDPKFRREFVRGLADARIAGLLVRLGEGFGAVPAEIVDEAGRRGLPLILLRRRIGFVEVTERVHGPSSVASSNCSVGPIKYAPSSLIWCCAASACR